MKCKQTLRPQRCLYLKGLHVREQTGALHACTEVGAFSRCAQFGQNLWLFLQQILRHGSRFLKSKVHTFDKNQMLTFCLTFRCFTVTDMISVQGQRSWAVAATCKTISEETLIWHSDPTTAFALEQTWAIYGQWDRHGLSNLAHQTLLQGIVRYEQAH